MNIFLAAYKKMNYKYLVFVPHPYIYHVYTVTDSQDSCRLSRQ